MIISFNFIDEVSITMRYLQKYCTVKDHPYPTRSSVRGGGGGGGGGGMTFFISQDQNLLLC